jgi:hypothetical protein
LGLGHQSPGALLELGQPVLQLVGPHLRLPLLQLECFVLGYQLLDVLLVAELHLLVQPLRTARFQVPAAGQAQSAAAGQRWHVAVGLRHIFPGLAPGLAPEVAAHSRREIQAVRVFRL